MLQHTSHCLSALVAAVLTKTNSRSTHMSLTASHRPSSHLASLVALRWDDLLCSELWFCVQGSALDMFERSWNILMSTVCQQCL